MMLYKLVCIKLICIMNKQRFFCLLLSLGLTTSSYAQFSAGVLGGIGHLWQRQGSAVPLSGINADQPVLMDMGNMPSVKK